MKCKQYQTRIFDLALEGPEKPNVAGESELRRHLGVCSACREAFERERRLAARVESTLKVSLAAEPSPHLAAQVQRQIARNAGRSEIAFRPWSHTPRWAGVAIVCAILVTGGLIWKTRRLAHSRSRIAALETARVEKSRAENLEYAGPRAKKSTRLIKRRLTVATSPSKVEAPVRATVKTARRARSERASRRVEAQAPQVLVPKNEMALILQLYYGTRSGVIDGASLVATPPGFKREPDGSLGIAPIEVRPIKIARLDFGSGNSGRSKGSPDETAPSDR